MLWFACTLSPPPPPPQRFRVCQLVARMLICASENDCRVGTDLLDAVQEVMLIRIQDKVVLYYVQL